MKLKMQKFESLPPSHRVPLRLPAGHVRRVFIAGETNVATLQLAETVVVNHTRLNEGVCSGYNLSKELLGHSLGLQDVALSHHVPVHLSKCRCVLY